MSVIVRSQRFNNTLIISPVVLTTVSQTFSVAWAQFQLPINEAPQYVAVAWVTKQTVTNVSASVTWNAPIPVAATKATTWAVSVRKFSELIDTFDTVIDSTKWNSANSVIDTGRIKAGTPSGAGIWTTSWYDMRYDAVYFKMDLTGMNQNYGDFVYLGSIAVGYLAKLYWTYNSGTPYITMHLDNSLYQLSVSYNAASMAYWRFREASGTLYIDTSPDGFTWTNRATRTYTSGVDPADASLTLNNGWFTGTVYYDNVNWHPTATQTFASTWNIAAGLASVSKTLAITWATNTTAVATLSSTWLAQQRVAQTKSLTWTYRQLVPVTSASTWLALAASAATTPSTWACRSLVAVTASSAWTIRQQVAQTRSVEWGAREVVSVEYFTGWLAGFRGSMFQEITWGTGGVTSTEAPIVWDDRALLSSEIGEEWQTLQAIETTSSLVWNDLTYITDVLVKRDDSSFLSLRNATASDVRMRTDTGWVSLRQPAVADVRIRNESNEWISLLWTSLRSVASLSSVEWFDRTALATLASIAWDDRGSVIQTAAESWIDRVAIAQTKASIWSDRSLVTQTKAPSWITRAAISASLAPTWIARSFVVKTSASTWVTNAAVVKTSASTWIVYVPFNLYNSFNTGTGVISDVNSATNGTAIAVTSSAHVPTYSSTAFSGTKSMQAASDGTSHESFVSWQIPLPYQPVYTRFYFRFPVLPSSSTPSLIKLLSTSTNPVADTVFIALTDQGKIRVRTTTGTHTGLSVNTWYRLECAFTISSLVARVYAGDSTTLIGEVTSSGASATSILTVGVVQVDGTSTAFALNGTFVAYFDEVSTGTVDWLGPMTTPVIQTKANTWADHTLIVQTVSVTWTTWTPNLLSWGAATMELSDQQYWSSINSVFGTPVPSMDIAASGTSSLKITSTASTQGGIIATAYTPVSPSTMYAVMFKIRSASISTTASVIVYFYQSNSAGLGGTGFDSVAINSSSWTMISKQVLSSSVGAYARIQITIEPGAIGNTFYIDEVGFIRGVVTTWLAPLAPAIQTKSVIWNSHALVVSTFNIVWHTNATGNPLVSSITHVDLDEYGLNWNGSAIVLSAFGNQDVQTPYGAAYSFMPPASGEAGIIYARFVVSDPAEKYTFLQAQDISNNFQIGVYLVDGNLVMGSQIDGYHSFSIAYDPDAHAFISLTFDGSYLHLNTSYDGGGGPSGWNQQYAGGGGGLFRDLASVQIQTNGSGTLTISHINGEA
jgi:hypothetical protein